MAVHRVPFTVVFQGFVEIEAPPIPPRDKSRKKRHLEAGIEWADKVAQNVQADVERWLTSPMQKGESRMTYRPPLKDMNVNVDLQTGYNALVRKATGMDIY
jgi:hypothetical protein